MMRGLMQKSVFLSNLLESGEILFFDVLKGKENSQLIFADFLKKIFIQNLQSMLNDLRKELREIEKTEQSLKNKKIILL